MTPYQRGTLPERKRRDLVDCRYVEGPDEALHVQQDIDYTRGFAHGVWFMRLHGHRFNTSRKWWMLWANLAQIRRGVAQGKKCKPLMWWLCIRFNIPA